MEFDIIKVLQIQLQFNMKLKFYLTNTTCPILFYYTICERKTKLNTFLIELRQH